MSCPRRGISEMRIGKRQKTILVMKSEQHVNAGHGSHKCQIIRFHDRVCESRVNLGMRRRSVKRLDCVNIRPLVGRERFRQGFPRRAAIRRPLKPFRRRLNMPCFRRSEQLPFNRVTEIHGADVMFRVALKPSQHLLDGNIHIIRRVRKRRKTVLSLRKRDHSARRRQKNSPETDRAKYPSHSSLPFSYKRQRMKERNEFDPPHAFNSFPSPLRCRCC